eukprot:5674301-Prymnesium_polylepis.1
MDRAPRRVARVARLGAARRLGRLDEAECGVRTRDDGVERRQPQADVERLHRAVARLDALVVGHRDSREQLRRHARARGANGGAVGAEGPIGPCAS